jgi:hypothetical protein
MRAVILFSGLLLLTLSTASCRHRATAKDYSEVRSACRAGNKEKAKNITLGLLEDEKFKIKFQRAVGVVGMFEVDYCNQLLILEVEKELQKPDDD